MTPAPGSSLERVLETLDHREPDRVPLFLFAPLHGARELGVPLRTYFSRPEQVVEGQLRLWRKYGHDAVSAYPYTAVDAEAWGAGVLFFDDGPPNVAEPPLRNVDQIAALEPPRVGECPGLRRVLRATEGLRDRLAGEVPIVGTVVSPFSLPVLQLGFEGYLDLLEERPDRAARLLAVNEEFCVAWANAQLAAGATAICYSDPVSSPTVVPPETYRKFGLPAARRTLARIRGPVAVHLNSGRCLPILDDVIGVGAAAVGVCSREDLATVKERCRGRLPVLGNLNGLMMRRWNAAEAEATVKEAIAAAGPGGGFILSDEHGEIPWQVPDEALLAVAEATRRWGRYPLTWVGHHG